MIRRHNFVPAAALVVACVVWGSTFVLVKDAVADFPAMQFLALRFIVGAVVLIVVWPRAAGRAWRMGPLPSLLIGGALAAGYGFQTVGLITTGPTNAGFITGLFVVFTPALGALIFRRLPSGRTLAGVALATAGLGLLSLKLVEGRPSLSGGDALVLICAVAFALHILALEKFAPSGDVKALAVGQLVVAAALFVAVTPAGGVSWTLSRDVVVALAVTAFGATAFGFAVQTWVQSKLSAAQTAVILTMEPVFAGVFGYLWAGDRLTVRGWIGAGLILAAMLLAESSPDSVDA